MLLFPPATSDSCVRNCRRCAAVTGALLATFLQITSLQIITLIIHVCSTSRPKRSPKNRGYLSALCTVFQLPLPVHTEPFQCAFTTTDGAGRSQPCAHKGVVQTPCCGRARCDLHQSKVCRCPTNFILLAARRKLQVEEKRHWPPGFHWCKVCKRGKVCKEHEGVEGCEFVVDKGSPKCAECKLGIVFCPRHMKLCSKEAWVSRDFCLRFKCSEHGKRLVAMTQKFGFARSRPSKN